MELYDALFYRKSIKGYSSKVIKKPLLEEITPDEKEHAEAQRLLNMLKYFESIPNEEVPTNSLLKEFLGGGNFKY